MGSGTSIFLLTAINSDYDMDKYLLPSYHMEYN